jgi:hypothetical protein
MKKILFLMFSILIFLNILTIDINNKAYSSEINDKVFNVIPFDDPEWP